MRDNNETQMSDDKMSEEDIRRIAREETSVRTSDGETISLADLVAQGLSKKQAIGALGMVAMGAAVGSAITIASSGTANATVTTGSGEISANEINANDLTVNTVSTSTITGPVVDTASEIHTLSGNLFVQDTEPTNANEGDLWLDTSGI